MSGIGGIGGPGGPGSFAGAGGIREIMALRQQIIERSQLLQQVHAAPDAASAAPAMPGSGFGATLQSALDGVNTAQSNADALSSAYEQGQTTDVAKVMMARQEASVGFEATLQVRNKLLSAYSDIMKFGV